MIIRKRYNINVRLIGRLSIHFGTRIPTVDTYLQSERKFEYFIATQK